MTDARKATLDAIAERFGVFPHTVYLLAGEVPNAAAYDAESDRRYRGVRVTHGRATGYDIALRGGIALDLSLDWALS